MVYLPGCIVKEGQVTFHDLVHEVDGGPLLRLLTAITWYLEPHHPANYLHQSGRVKSKT